MSKTLSELILDSSFRESVAEKFGAETLAAIDAESMTKTDVLNMLLAADQQEVLFAITYVSHLLNRSSFEYEQLSAETIEAAQQKPYINFLESLDNPDLIKILKKLMSHDSFKLRQKKAPVEKEPKSSKKLDNPL